ncbi:MAG: hypothetical protein Q9182_001642 [Xanthomendoza sp. 2 TL-2023]
MASILFAGGVLAYEKIKESKAKKVAKKAHNAARYSDLQSATCTCDTGVEKEAGSKGCPVHDAPRDMNEGGAERRGSEEEDSRGRDSGVVREKEESGVYNGSREGEEEPPRYEDVAGPVGKRGFKDRMFGRKEKEGGDGVVRL